MNEEFTATIVKPNLKKADRSYFNHKILKQWKISAKCPDEAHECAESQFAADYPDEKRDDYEIDISWNNS